MGGGKLLRLGSDEESVYSFTPVVVWRMGVVYCEGISETECVPGE